MNKAPSFNGYRPASEASSRAKKANRRRDTDHEILLRRELWQMGLHYRKNVESLPGKPDIVFSKSQVVVFCNGDFWHGRDWPTLRENLKHRANASYWIQKIESNRERDERTTAWWKEAGWRVVRLWETDIKKDPTAAAKQVQEAVTSRTSAKEA